MKKSLLPIALAISLALTACASERPDGFDDKAQKERIWSAYRCESLSNLSAAFVRTRILQEILHDDIPMDEIPEARRWERRLERASEVGDVMEYRDVEGIDNMCSGWLWERETQRADYKDGYDEFTADKAIEAGVAA